MSYETFCAELLKLLGLSCRFTHADLWFAMVGEAMHKTNSLPAGGLLRMNKVLDDDKNLLVDQLPCYHALKRLVSSPL